jgi:hypothetical protein
MVAPAKAKQPAVSAQITDNFDLQIARIFESLPFVFETDSLFAGQRE